MKQSLYISFSIQSAMLEYGYRYVSLHLIALKKKSHRGWSENDTIETVTAYRCTRLDIINTIEIWTSQLPILIDAIGLCQPGHYKKQNKMSATSEGSDQSAHQCSRTGANIVTILQRFAVICYGQNVILKDLSFAASSIPLKILSPN